MLGEEGEGGKGVIIIMPYTSSAKREEGGEEGGKSLKSGIPFLFYTYIYKYMSAPPPSAAPGSLTALIYITVSFLRGYYVNVPYISPNQIQYSICYTPSLHDVCLCIQLGIRTLMSG